MFVTPAQAGVQYKNGWIPACTHFAGAHIFLTSIAELSANRNNPTDNGLGPGSIFRVSSWPRVVMIRIIA